MSQAFDDRYGATAAVEALAETLCYLDAHRHTVDRPACSGSRRRAGSIIRALEAGPERGLAVGRWLSRASEPESATHPGPVLAAYAEDYRRIVERGDGA